MRPCSGEHDLHDPGVPKRLTYLLPQYAVPAIRPVVVPTIVLRSIWHVAP